MYRSDTVVRSDQGSAVTATARSAALPFILLTTALLLSACAQGKVVANYAGVKQPKNPAHGVAESASVAAQTPAKSDQTAATADAPATPKAAVATIWRSADKLLGLAADELQAALGAPARIRDEDTSRIYQYVGTDCVLDLFLYQEATGSYRVSYAEARSIDAEKKPVDLCLKSLPAPIVADNAPSS